jgi:hypothetical protein
MGRSRTKRRVGRKSRRHLFDPKPAQIVVSDRRGVNKYVKAHPSLHRQLNDLFELARQTFGPDAELALSVYRDPDIDDQYLTLYVRLEQYTPDVLDHIESLNHALGDSQKGANGHILMTTDFRRPEGSHAV